MENQSHLTTQGSENEPKTESEIRQARIKELLESQEERTEKIEKIKNEIKKLKAILVEMQKTEQGVKIRKENLDPEIEALIDNLKIGINGPTDAIGAGHYQFKNNEVEFDDPRRFAKNNRGSEMETSRIFVHPININKVSDTENKKVFLLDGEKYYFKKEDYKKRDYEIEKSPYFFYVLPNWTDSRGSIFTVIVKFDNKKEEILNSEVLENFRKKFDEYTSGLFTTPNRSRHTDEVLKKIKTGEIVAKAKQEIQRILKEVVLEYENKDAIQEPVEQEIEEVSEENSNETKNTDIESKIADTERRRMEELSNRNITKQNTDGKWDIAADYLLNNGIGTVLSTDYFLLGVAGTFTRVTGLIDNIRNKYAKELADKSLVDLEKAIGSETYNNITNEIKKVIEKEYGNMGVEQFDKILKSPTGVISRIGNEIYSKIESLNEEIEAKINDQYDTKIAKLKSVNLNETKKKQEIPENSIEQKQVFSNDKIKVGAELDENLKNKNFKIESTSNPNEYTFSLDEEGRRVMGFYEITFGNAIIKGKKQSPGIYFTEEDIKQEPGIVEIKNGVITKIIKQLEIQFLPEDKEQTVNETKDKINTKETEEIQQTMGWFFKEKNKLEERVAKRIYRVPDSSAHVKLNEDGTYKETGFLNEEYEYETYTGEYPEWKNNYNKIKNMYQDDTSFLAFLNSEITENFIKLGKKLGDFKKIEDILNEKYDSFRSEILSYATNLDANPTAYLNELHYLDTKYPERQVKNEVNKIFKTEIAELETKGNNPKPKRDGRENYEGWETRYHHDIEADGKIKIKKETLEQKPMSLYELKEKDGQMALFLLESNSTTKMLGAFARRQLEPLFNLPEGRSDSPDIKLIKTVKPAKFRKEGDFWVLDEKGEVEYIK